MSYDIRHLRGMKNGFLHRLHNAGIYTTEDLLQSCCRRSTRNQLASVTGISAACLLSFAQKAELLRLEGVNKEYYKLFHEAGIRSLEDLSHVKSDELSDEIKIINQDKHIAKAPPKKYYLEHLIDKARDHRSQIEL